MEDDEEDTRQGKLSDDDGPGWVIGTITKTVQHLMESFRQKQLGLEELTQPDGGMWPTTSMREICCVGTAELNVPAVMKPQTDTIPATPPLKTFGDPLQTLGIVPRQSQTPQVPSGPGSSQMRLGSKKEL